MTIKKKERRKKKSLKRVNVVIIKRERERDRNRQKTGYTNRMPITVRTLLVVSPQSNKFNKLLNCNSVRARERKSGAPKMKLAQRERERETGDPF